jgi:hypothetical protein
MSGARTTTALAALAALAGALLLPACAQPQTSSATPPPDAQCDAARLSNVLGQPGGDQLAEAARVQAGARVVRIVRHDEMVTKEYLVGRLSLWLDASGRVREANCG